MNSSSEHCNVSDWLRLEATVKASVYVVAFSITTSLTVVIIAIVSQSLQLRKEVRLVLLLLWPGGHLPRNAGLTGQQPPPAVLAGIWGAAKCGRRDPPYSDLDGSQYLPRYLLSIELSILCGFC